MRLRYVGESSGADGCPALYEIEDMDPAVADGKEWVMVQGKRADGPEIPGQLVGLQDNEHYVMVPKDLIRKHLDLFAEEESG
jgi:hypothetical protein